MVCTDSSEHSALQGQYRAAVERGGDGKGGGRPDGHGEGDCFNASTADESNAFTFVEVCFWHALDQCLPPIRRRDLPIATRGVGPDSELVWPAYRRLAMGAKDSAGILLAINRHTMRKILIRTRWKVTISQINVYIFEQGSDSKQHQALEE